jgi:hypothetical protein
MPKADFKSWTRKGLEDFARETADEIPRLQEENKMLLKALRAEIMRTGLAEAPAESPAPVSLSQYPPPV